MSTKKLQIIGSLGAGNKIYTQTEEPIDAPENALWVDLDAEGVESGVSIAIDATLTQEGQAADAKAVGDKLAELEVKVEEAAQTGGTVKTVNGIEPDENGNIEIEVTSSGAQVQPDWEQTDETAPDFIKNKPDEMDALALVSEMEFVAPVVDEDNSVYLDDSNNILIV